MSNKAVNKQVSHYEKIHDEYGYHYYDNESVKYRKKFIYEPLIKNLKLKNNTVVADLASGDGINTSVIHSYYPKTSFVGFDISPKACKEYKKITGFASLKVDLTEQFSINEKNRYYKTFDIAIIIGGLHHCVTNLNNTFTNIANLIKTDGYLLMCEPNSQYILEPLRKIWYKNDKYFESDTEHALNHDKILKIASDKFKLEFLSFKGGLAYFLIYNSLIFRMPKHIKRFISPALIKQEYLFNMLPGRVPFAYFLAKWKKL